MFSADKGRMLLFIIIFLACIIGIERVAKAHGDSPAVLLLGLELKDLDLSERSRFAHYTVLERPYLKPEQVKEIVKQAKPVSVIIRQPSGGVYEYSAEGNLIGQLNLVDPRASMLEKQRQAQPGQGSMGAAGNGAMGLAPGMQVPVQINGQMQIGYPSSNAQFMPQSLQMGQPNYPMQRMLSPNMGYGMQPYVPRPGSQMSRQVAYMPPQAMVYAGNQNSNSMLRPFPGGNVPSYLFPGKSQYSYLPGEGDHLPPPGYSRAREAIKQAASLIQNNAYPFWFDSYLTTNSDISGSTSLPSLQFSANTTANPAIVGSQWVGTGIGLGGTLIDAALESAEIRARREGANREALGTAYYYYPDYAYSRYQALPYQPLPTSAWY